MVEISPSDLLPENYARFKDSIPNLKLSERLSKYNPLKYILKGIENKQTSGILFKLCVLFFLFGMTSIAFFAFCGNQPGSLGLIMLLFPVFGVSIISLEKSPFAPHSIIQIIGGRRAKKIIKNSEISAEKQQEIKKLIKQMTIDRLIITIFLSIFILSYYQIAYYLNDMSFDLNSISTDWFRDKAHSMLLLPADIFIKFLLMSVISINVIVYSGNIFIPYENILISEYIKSGRDNKFKKYIYLPIKKIVWYSLFLIVGFSFSSAIFSLDKATVITTSSILILFVFWGWAIIIHVLFILIVAVLRTMALVLDKVICLFISKSN